MISLGILGMLGASGTAHAAGVGSSLGIAVVDGDEPRAGAFLPSLDLHFEPVLIQFHVGEFLRELSQGDVQVGANVYFTAGEAGLPGQATAVVQPGVGLDLLANPTIVRLTGECRVGGQLASDRGGVGIYVVPTLGLALGDGAPDNAFIVGGALQVSAWLGG